MRSICKLLAAGLVIICTGAFAPGTLRADEVAGGNLQQIIPLSSPAYTALDSLYLEEGIVEPSTARPYSADEMSRALEKIDRGALSTAGRAAYKIVEGTIDHRTVYGEKDGLQVNVRPTITVAGYLATDPHAVNEGASNRDWRDRSPLLNVPLEVWLFSNFYADFDLTLKEDPFLQNPGVVPGAKESNFTNVPFDFAQVDFMFPFRAFMSLGGNHWNLQFGRDQLNWGNGQFGNLMLAANGDYYDFLRFTTYWNAFKYTATAISLPPYYPGQDTATVTPADINPSIPNNDVPGYVLTKTMLAHRLEFSLWNRVNLALNEALMVSGKVGLNHYNPLDIYHNWFDWEQSKSLFSGEVTVAPVRWLSLYGQFGMDQIQTGLKNSEYGADSIPNGLAWLAGARTEYPLGPGYLSVDAQFTNVGPWIYLAGDPSQTSGQFQEPWLSYYARSRIVSNVMGSRQYVSVPTGWWDGPDSRAYDLSFTYSVPAVWSATLGASLVQHGENTLDTLYEKGASAASMRTPGPTPINTLTVQIGGSVTPIAPLTIGGDLYYVHVWNVGHEAGRTEASVLGDLFVKVGL